MSSWSILLLASQQPLKQIFSVFILAQNAGSGMARLLGLKRKDCFPIILHADHGPTVLLRLIVKRLREGADLRIGKPVSRAVRILAGGVVMQDDHRQPGAIASFR